MTAVSDHLHVPMPGMSRAMIVDSLSARMVGSPICGVGCRYLTMFSIVAANGAPGDEDRA